MNNLNIGVFTGNRAEYGLLHSTIKSIHNSNLLNLKLIVAGAHLESKFGNTINEILSDGFDIAATIPFLSLNSEPSSTPLSIARGIESLVKSIKELDIDLLIVYADRFEGFSAVIAASQMNIPVAHIEGGDLTEGGALDDSVRHAMSKLSHLHFTTNQQASNRLLAMGEESWRVKTVGLPSLDGVYDGDFCEPNEVLSLLDINLKYPILLFTLHSITTADDLGVSDAIETLLSLESLAKQGCNLILTYPNNDNGGEKIIDLLFEFSSKFNSSNIILQPSLGRRLYHGVLNLRKNLNANVVCVGNSSSGIKETPAFSVPTVNIGERQKGRLRAENVIDVVADRNDILNAINKCLYDKTFIETCDNATNPYWFGPVGDNIVHVLESTTISEYLIQKGMTLKGEICDDGCFR